MLNTRTELRVITLELLAVGGFDPTSPEYGKLSPKPVKFVSTMDEEELTVEVARFAKTLAADNFGGADVAAFSDVCSLFLINQGVITVQEDDFGAAPVEELTEADLFGEEDDGLDAALVAAPEVPEMSEDAFGPEVPSVPIEVPLQSTDEKVAALTAEQGEQVVPVGVSAPEFTAAVTIQNIEAAVLSMIELLREGKVIQISAHEVTSSIVGVPSARTFPEPAAPMTAAAASAPVQEQAEDPSLTSQRKRVVEIPPEADLVEAAKSYVCRWKKLPDVETAKRAARLVLGIGAYSKEDKKKIKFPTDRDRRLFIIANKIPLAKKYDVNTVNGKPLANAIVKWFAATRVADEG